MTSHLKTKMSFFPPHLLVDGFLNYDNGVFLCYGLPIVILPLAMYDCFSKACVKTILDFLNISKCLFTVFVTSSEHTKCCLQSPGLGYLNSQQP